MFTIVNSLKNLLEAVSFDLWGHEMFPGGIFMNIVLAFSGLAILKIAVLVRDKTKNIYKVLLGWLYLLYLPNAFYLFLEIKHLVLKDNIADDLTIPAVMFFSLISLLGLYLTVVTILETIQNVSLLGEFPLVSMSGLSTISSFGALVGFYNVNSINGIVSPFAVLTQIPTVFYSESMMQVFIVSSIGLSMLCIAIYTLFYRKKGCKR